MDRGARLVAEFGGVDRERALELLREANGRAKVAILMAARGLNVAEAERALEAAGGVLDRTLNPDNT